MNRNICIHGHFYQPPRENPWLEEIEIQDSAAPYRDWNERVCAECYAPNAASRILDEDENIIDIVNNYSKISFNFGPTLLSWMKRFRPLVYQKILEADHLSCEKFAGHGAAMAQAYNHMIMPLANDRDKQTQVLWGIRDFESRYGRKPEGMWLPETAVDYPTLEVLARQGILFSVLSPYQALRFRKVGEEGWTDVPGSGIDPQVPYLCRLPSGAQISLFFYDGPISQDVAFSGLLNNGEAMKTRLTRAFLEDDKEPRLAHIATDGETYGHHHRFGNMALSYCLHLLDTQKDVDLIVYGKYLADHPPEHEVDIKEDSSWSCSHGVERWRANCGCCIGGHVQWTQKWRAPLREAMDWLRDQLIPVYEQQMSGLAKDPWQARDEYIDVVLSRKPENVDRFLKDHCHGAGDAAAQVRCLKLLEIQRHAMLMYTSCGWFFDDISGIETIQIMQYAARAMQLAKDLTGQDLEPGFLAIIKKGVSNKPDKIDGEQIYQTYVRPDVTDLLHVGAHYAISSVFEDHLEESRIYAYDVRSDHFQKYGSGKHKFVIGRALVRSFITREELSVEYAVLHFGDYNISGGVRPFVDQESYERMHQSLQGTFHKNDIPEIIQQMNEAFGHHHYSLWDLFKNEQGKVLDQIFETTLESIEVNFRAIYEHYYPLMTVRPDIRIPLPKALSMTVEFILNRDFTEALNRDSLDFNKLERLARELKRWSFARDREALAFAAVERIDRIMADFSRDPRQLTHLNELCKLMKILRSLSLRLDLWKSQNIYFSIAKDLCQDMAAKAANDDKAARSWLSKYKKLGKYLKVKVAT